MINGCSQCERFGPTLTIARPGAHGMAVDEICMPDPETGLASLLPLFAQR
jgi:hypothetical protein